MNSIDTIRLLDKSDTLEELNRRLFDELYRSDALMLKLGEYWEGEAFDELTEVFRKFASTYFEDYKEMLGAYIRFLRETVADHYAKTEETNISNNTGFIND